ncbi:MAG TPA: barstar family protein [Candidatus Dormibacteraeota bacterium]|nr:barstar family protein [Candidatus Dormibacteraeota bacterium]
MREVVIDGRNWNSVDNVYDAFFEAVGAPSWHGRNFNALRDGIATGRINKIEVPYLIRIKNYDSVGTEAKTMAAGFVQLIKDLRKSGCPVDIEIENGEIRSRAE